MLFFWKYGKVLNSQIIIKRSKLKSRWQSTGVISDRDFADDIALLSNKLKQDQLFLKFPSSKLDCTLITPKLSKCCTTKQVDYFLYLGSWINSCSKNIDVRIGNVWRARQKMETTWKLIVSSKIKVEFFRVTVETLVLYDGSVGNVKKALIKKLDGAYTKMLGVLKKNVSWQQYMTNQILYGNLPKLMTITAERRVVSITLRNNFSLTFYCKKSKTW